MVHPITSYRRDQGLTLAELATRVNCSKATLSRIENGKADPSVDLIRRLMAVTDLPWDAFAPLKASLAPSTPASRNRSTREGL